MKVCRVEEMRDLDQRAIKDYGISEDLLMENAGLASFHVIKEEFGIGCRRFLIICGIGNNGGDGLVVARKLHSMGGRIQIIFIGDPSKFKGAARRNLEVVSNLGLETKRMESPEILQDAILCSDIIIDAVFGTGLDRIVEGRYAEALRMISQSSLPVVSLDIPSGIHGDTGEVMGTAVSADATVAFGLPKLGNLLYPGFEHCGKLFVSHISFPPELTASPGLKFAVNRPLPLPPRKPDSHKGEFGDVLIISGSSSYLGAPYFSALSFMKAGGGYSRLAAPASLIPSIAAKGSEIVFAPMEETSSGTLAKSSLRELIDLADKVDMVIMGPGLSLHEETQDLCRRLVPGLTKPLLIDGDGLTALAQDPSILLKRAAPTILTPHLGEMARLTAREIPEVRHNPAYLLQKYAEEWKAVIVLKGAHSLIGKPDGSIFINLSGNSGMATAGSGDVLTGTIAAMYGLGLDIEDAVRTGVFMHGFSGDLAAAEKGEDGITAGDIQDALPEAVRLYRQNYESIIASDYESIYLI